MVYSGAIICSKIFSIKLFVGPYHHLNYFRGRTNYMISVHSVLISVSSSFGKKLNYVLFDITEKIVIFAIAWISSSCFMTSRYSFHRLLFIISLLVMATCSTDIFFLYWGPHFANKSILVPYVYYVFANPEWLIYLEW